MEVGEGGPKVERERMSALEQEKIDIIAVHATRGTGMRGALSSFSMIG